MARKTKPFYVYERKRPGKPSVWYARFRAADGTIGSPLCTETSSRKAAEAWALERLLSKETTPLRKLKGKTFGEWAKPWWLFDTCPYIREKVDGGFNISRAYAQVRRSYLVNHLIPEFRDVPLTALTPIMFRDFKGKLQAAGALSPASINRILGTARVMFNYAVRMGELQNNPVAPVTELKEEPRARGILSMQELAALFGPGALQRVWHDDPRHYGLNIVAASTGLRLGECQALRVQDLAEPGFLAVTHSWDDRWGLGAPKWGSARIVPLPAKAAAVIEALLELHRWGEPQPEDVLFWGRDRRTPLTKTAILNGFKSALARIGIPEGQRASRNLLFHSYRHGFNTYIRGKVPDEQLRRVTGHKTLAMTDNYDHAVSETLRDVAAVQDTVFSFEGEEVVRGEPGK